ncbi:hypothetical protein V5799_004775 [Amblyomma americanum]|uniref:Uncharacterized protein n=1 Tax=Amblyomma americanum TaxID=6943 RepID=A0AAQ4D554_AMBAM
MGSLWRLGRANPLRVLDVALSALSLAGRCIGSSLSQRSTSSVGIVTSAVMAFTLMGTAANRDRGPGPQSSQHSTSGLSDVPTRCGL